ncbi:MAG TPA: hypothetical protein VN174_02000 [Candidatus Methanoperedens sp.]|nr:hypothetical protein [Candidatus Methanoperedens sp.]
MNKKVIFVLLFLIILGIIFALVLSNGSKKDSSKKNNTNTTPISSEKKGNADFLLTDFPLDKVPLYKLSKVSSNKIFVNTDPKNISAFGQNNFAYYNVVFYSDATKEEFLKYYKDLFESQITEEYENSEMVKGTIGQYKVTAAHYGSDNTGYIQVYLSDINDEKINKHFTDFPDIFKASAEIIEHEKSYGLLNQKGGEIEFTKYFTVIDSGDANKDGKDDVDEFLKLETEYKEQYQQKTNYSYDQTSGLMRWKDGEYEAYLTISKGHGRIYLMLRKNIINQ